MLLPLLLALTGDPQQVEVRTWVTGQMVELCGDLDGDGRSEFAMSGGTTDSPTLGVIIYRGLDGGVFRCILPQAKDEFIGTRFSRTGDLDHDGVNDMALAVSSSIDDRACVEFRSGASGNMIRSILPESDEASFGIGIASIGDVNHDGVDDLVVTALHPAPWNEWSGACWVVVSGADGKRLQKIEWCWSRSSYWHLAASNPNAVALGDVNADGVPDFAIIDELTVRVQSGARQETLHRFELPDQPAKRGDRYSVCGQFDLDCDGCNDVAIASPFICGHDWDNTYEYVRIYSGRTGELLRTISRPPFYPGFGFAMLAVPDLIGAGTFDLWITQHDPFANGAYLLSAEDGQERRAISSKGDDFVFGWDLRGGADVDGDGTDDLIVGSYSPFASNYPASGGSVYSGKDGRLLFQKQGDSQMSGR